MTSIHRNLTAARVVADSISPDKVRLTTLEVVLPRIVLAEFNTHRMFSRNSASSRAIPVEKMLRRVNEDPFVPAKFGLNQPGMQASEFATGDKEELAQYHWIIARDRTLTTAKDLSTMGIHKQTVNRLLEPFSWHTILVTATEWANFFALRCHKDAQPEIREAAECMVDAMDQSTPREIGYGQWHRPLYGAEFHEDTKYANETWSDDQRNRISVGRCARVSYLTHHGTRDPSADLDLADGLRKSGHMSPFEHVARPMTTRELQVFERYEWTHHTTGARTQLPPGEGDEVAWSRGSIGSWLGNFRGWVQLRKTLPGESVFNG